MSDKYLNSTGIATIRDWVKGLIKNNFSNVKANGTSVGPASSDSAINFAPGSGISITGAAGTSTSDAAITISADISNATTQAAGLMSAADKTKLNGIESGAEVNQNAFSTVGLGVSTVAGTIAAGSKSSEFDLIIKSGSSDNLSVSGNKATFTVKDTTYSNATTQAAGLMSSADKTKLNAVDVNANDGYDEIQVDEGVPGWTSLPNTNGILQLERGANIQLTVVPTAPVPRVNISATDTTYSVAATNADGLMSSSDKTKLNGIATGAEVNVQADWNQTTTTHDAYIKNKPTNLNQFTNGPGYQTASEVQALIDAAVSATYKYKGSVASYSNLPASGNTTGDVWNVEDTGMNYAWNGTAWDSLGGLVDLTGYWAKTELVAFTAAEVTAILTA